MKNATANRRMTLLLMRDAQHSVKQIHLSKSLLLAVPAVAVLSLSGLILALQAHSSQVISRLEEEVSLENIKNVQLQSSINSRDQSIERLQNEMIKLSSQAKDMQQKMQHVDDLEQKLQQFIDKHNISMSTDDSTDHVSTLSWDASQHVGGEYIAVHTNEILDLAQETKDDFQEMQELLKTMENQIPHTLKKAQETQVQITGAPTLWPTASKVLTSSFGYRTDPFTGKAAFHAGIDIAGENGGPVYAAGTGKVVTADESGARGRYVVIEHPSGLQTWYMHLSKILVNVGESVDKGEQIAFLGSTGRSTGPHLHFQVVKDDKPVNPLPYIQKNNSVN
ncbi:peptidoglycan DD-metalloendopeptidase family protein [Paenibacillus sp.]|jgi:murein DD-endopeptidase MepM/ murein hydrolase activator NlpD|uniref:peptidoglycan DD-metalloendopeptidase family protein n=1 Tax=Paenibacillus sp. TaxID=58172 RepID=UPI00282FB38C|nr:peptidoglycan DD-metalloendopeptidase family protein [Paenibacillus sp.]MDR0268325.1 M23 family metallopeptidase [Paenibacillus sp.]